MSFKKPAKFPEVPNFTILKLLGSGSHAKTYLARSEHNRTTSFNSVGSSVSSSSSLNTLGMDSSPEKQSLSPLVVIDNAPNLASSWKDGKVLDDEDISSFHRENSISLTANIKKVTFDQIDLELDSDLYNSGMESRPATAKFIEKANNRTSDDVLVALKVVPRGIQGMAHRRLLEECIQHNLAPRHPHIAGLLDVILTSTDLVIVMEYCAGNTLLNKLLHTPTNRFTVQKAKAVFYQLLSALAALHAKNICHRDVKCDNILLYNNVDASSVQDASSIISDEEIIIKLADFGYARNDPTHCRASCGTPQYAAPEVFDKEHSEYNGTKTDIWAATVVFYTMLYGQYPFVDPNLPEDPASVLALVRRIEYKIPALNPAQYHPDDDTMAVDEELRLLFKSVFVRDQKLRPSASYLMQKYKSWSAQAPESSSWYSSALQRMPSFGSSTVSDEASTAYCCSLCQEYREKHSISRKKSLKNVLKSIPSAKNLKVFSTCADKSTTTHSAGCASSHSSLKSCKTPHPCYFSSTSAACCCLTTDVIKQRVNGASTIPFTMKPRLSEPPRNISQDQRQLMMANMMKAMKVQNKR